MNSRKICLTAIVCIAAAAAAGDSIRRIDPTVSPRHTGLFFPKVTATAAQPGLIISILSAAIGSDGTITAAFSVIDSKGLPLDLAGR
jgi:hypothetical protein